MAFVPEDGTGKSDANSYVSVAYADTYWSDRNLASWAALTETEKQAALIYATDYIEANYRRIYGNVLELTQALQYPATSSWNPKNDTYFDNDEIPDVLKQAVCILAKSQGVDGVDLNAPIERVASSEKVGPIAVSYEEGSSSRTIQIQIDGLLLGIMEGGAASSGQINLYRG